MLDERDQLAGADIGRRPRHGTIAVVVPLLLLPTECPGNATPRDLCRRSGRHHGCAPAPDTAASQR